MIPLLGEMSAKQTKGCLNSENLPPPSILSESRGGVKTPPYHINTNTNPNFLGLHRGAQRVTQCVDFRQIIFLDGRAQVDGFLQHGDVLHTV